MVDLKGKYGFARCFSDTLDSTTLSQIRGVCDQPFADDEIVRMMPDAHAGAGCTIGTTMTISRKIVVPNFVGVDIACGVYTVKLEERNIDFARLDEVIRENVPLGFNVNKRRTDFPMLEELRCREAIKDKLPRAYKSIGSLGGGNHYQEIDEAQDGALYLGIHSGSRNIGKLVADYYTSLAGFSIEDTRKSLEVENLKSLGHPELIQGTLEELKESKGTIPYIAYELFDDYIHDSVIMNEYAKLNRETIAKKILVGMRLTAVDAFHTVHNYIDTDRTPFTPYILRKGAVSAYEGELLVIPMNMRDGTLLCRGKGNADWNYSAPHGAGRIMGRGQAKRTLSMDEFRATMAGVFTTSVSEETLDEAPMAYKPMDEIIDAIGDTVEILDILKPVYNIKDDTKKRKRR